MTKYRLFNLAAIALIFVMIISVFNTVNVSADDSTPPPATEEAIATDEPVSTEEAVATEEPVATEEAVATDEPAVTEEPTAEQELTVAEVFEQAPENTQIVVIDSEGNVAPLASEEALDIITQADPIWCKDGVTPDPTDPN